MRSMSLQSDLEGEIWNLLHEMVFRHNLSREEAYSRAREAMEKSCRDFEYEWGPE